MRTHFVLSALAIIGLAWVQPVLAWTLAVALLLVLGLAAELINGALEASLDRLQPGHDQEIGAAKDMHSWIGESFSPARRLWCWGPRAAWGLQR